MLGVGPGALVTDAHMLGIDPNVQRKRMDESLGIILRLFTETEPITYISDWFELHDAMLQVRPYTKPHMPVAVASVRSPSGPALADKHGAAVLSMSVPRETEERADMTYLWDVAEESAAAHGQTVNRDEWRLVLPVHLAESRDEAIKDIRMGAGQFNREYLEETLGRPLEFDGPVEKIIDYLMDTGQWIIGSPDDCVETIHRLAERSGGFGGFLVGFTQDLAPREKVLRSYELMARYVMPHFQGSLAGLHGSNQWARGRADHTREAMAHAVDVAKQAYESRGDRARST
jgi:limonene 1,2-monooxygenase